MPREYAVMDAQRRILFQTPGFDPARVGETVPLSGGHVLCIGDGDGPADEMASLRRQLQEANAANAAKEAFLSNMSHDIRTPMNAIVGMTALAKRHIDEKPRVADALNKIETASAHLLSLINDVLDMSRINSGRMTLAAERFSLSDLLHDVVTLIRPLMEKKGHTWQLEAENIEAESFYGDALRLRQVFVNIISNAVKYTPDGGRVLIGVTEEVTDGRCLLTFTCRDSGIGMTPEFLQRIFEPFERVNSSTISRIEGTGLGMSIVKKIVEAMEGTIVLDSAPGQGTLVTIRVPLLYEQEQTQAAALQQQRLLIMEADEKLRGLYTRYLDEFSVRYTLVSSAAEGVAALAKADFCADPYRAAVIGRRQENSGGVLDIAAYLHKSHPGLSLILVSDCSWEDIEYQAGRSGIGNFIPLPFFRKSLINGLNRALGADGGDGERASGTPDLTGKRLLLVEDNLINREIALEILRVTNAEIDTAEDGRQAVDCFLASPEGGYSLILMDVQMPVMDGYAATREIRQSGRPDAVRVPIYAMTANTFAEDIAKARDAGMNGHIAKPIDINTLMQVLRQAQQ